MFYEEFPTCSGCGCLTNIGRGYFVNTLSHDGHLYCSSFVSNNCHDELPRLRCFRGIKPGIVKYNSMLPDFFNFPKLKLSGGSIQCLNNIDFMDRSLNYSSCYHTFLNVSSPKKIISLCFARTNRMRPVCGWLKLLLGRWRYSQNISQCFGGLFH